MTETHNVSRTYLPWAWWDPYNCFVNPMSTC